MKEWIDKSFGSQQIFYSQANNNEISQSSQILISVQKKQGNLRIGVFYNVRIGTSNFAQEGQFFIRVIGIQKEKMKSSFNFFSATAKWIECILKTLFELVLTKVTQPKSQSSQWLYPYRAVTTKSTVCSWFYEFQDFSFKDVKCFRTANVRS